MAISMNSLTPDKVNRRVIYCKGEVYEDRGRITSWNDHYVFVDYNNSGRGVATKAVDLQWEVDHAN